ncbi:hypothetical protein [Paenirhodobacter populi]|uniref:Uncharacterized protein n=1 Tax=Paenirhodobacter populi TaxID=2306993 RepID=A0A443JR67_9RHOB|nr:hypothetical protein [Sinirhodobacter populi]RWR22972.1 hypothetical protein D2T30_04915 [Sinirhodobacter populi]
MWLKINKRVRATKYSTDLFAYVPMKFRLIGCGNLSGMNRCPRETIPNFEEEGSQEALLQKTTLVDYSALAV